MMFPRYNEASGWIGFTNKAPDMTSEIYLLNRTGDRIKKVLTGAAIEDFSPDGKFFLYTSCDGKAELFVYSLDRKRASKISQKLKVTAANWPRWRMDRCFSAGRRWHQRHLSDFNSSSGIIRLTDTKKVNETFPVFTNDEKYLVYFTDRYGSNELEYMNIETRQLQRPNVGGLFPSLSPDNKHVAYQLGESVPSAASMDSISMCWFPAGHRSGLNKFDLAPAECRMAANKIMGRFFNDQD
jgi:Tol biopolymer transport system component